MKFLYSPTEVNTQRKINLDHTSQSQEIQKAVYKQWEESKGLF